MRKARTLLSVYAAEAVEYRAEIVLWILSMTLPLIMMGLWAQAGSRADYGMDSLDFIRYFFAVFFVRQMTVVWVIYVFQRDVVQGRLSPKLLQPIDPAWHYLCFHVAERWTRVPIVAGLIAFFFLLYPKALWAPRWDDALLAVPALAMAFGLRFLMQYTTALASFWVERASMFEQVMFLFYLFLSGMLAPLDVYPQAVREAVMWTPFPYLVYFPTTLLTGRATNIPQSFAMLLGWTAVIFVINRLIWRQGLKHYSAMGA